MRKLPFIIITIIGTLPLCSCKKDNLTGKEFQGYYYTCERLSIDFNSDSKVTGCISSTDFVGHFSDVIYGHYDYKHPYVNIVWEKTNPRNDKYKELIPNPDSLIVNEALDTLLLYEKGVKYELPKYSFFNIDKNAPLKQQIGDLTYQLFLFIIVFFFKNIFPITIVIILFLLFFVIKRIVRRKRNSV